MKKFLWNIAYFILTISILIFLLVISTAYYTKKTFDFNIPLNKNILILGNSHPECAINDSLIPNTFNLAQSASGYFYDYVKAREILNQNSQIDTIILGFAYSDLEKKMDKWVDGEEKIKFKLRSHLFLFQFKDYFNLLKANPIAVIYNTPQTAYYNLMTKRHGYKYLGGHKSLRNSEIKKAKELLEGFTPDSTLGLSQYQTKYLRRIYDLCKKKNVQLMLLAPPIHPKLDSIQTPLKEKYNHFAKHNLPNAMLINHSDLKLPEDHFRDLDHLNYKGAKIYSEYLKTNTLKISKGK